MGRGPREPGPAVGVPEGQGAGGGCQTLWCHKGTVEEGGVKGPGKMVRGVVQLPRGQVWRVQGGWEVRLLEARGQQTVRPPVLSPLCGTPRGATGTDRVLLQKLRNKGPSLHLRGTLWPGVRLGRPSGAPTSAGATTPPQGSVGSFGGLPSCTWALTCTFPAGERTSPPLVPALGCTGGSSGLQNPSSVAFTPDLCALFG